MRVEEYEDGEKRFTAHLITEWVYDNFMWVKFCGWISGKDFVYDIFLGSNIIVVLYLYHNTTIMFLGGMLVDDYCLEYE